MIYIRDLIGVNRAPNNDPLFDSILQPALYEQSEFGYEEFYLLRRRVKAESWVLLQPERKGEFA